MTSSRRSKGACACVRRDDPRHAATFINAVQRMHMRSSSVCVHRLYILCTAFREVGKWVNEPVTPTCPTAA